MSVDESHRDPVVVGGLDAVDDTVDGVHVDDRKAAPYEDVVDHRSAERLHGAGGRTPQVVWNGGHEPVEDGLLPRPRDALVDVVEQQQAVPVGSTALIVDRCRIPDATRVRLRD